MSTPKFLYDFGISQDDPTTELKVLDLSRDDRVLCIASGGEVPLELLINSGASVEIDAVDISEAQLYLSNLKMQAAIHLEGRAAEFLGYLPATKAQRETWLSALESALSYEEVRFWKSNLKILNRGPILYGRYETYISRFVPLGRWLLGGTKKMMGLFECEDIEQQQEYFDRELRTKMLKILFRIMFSRHLYTNRGVSERGLMHMDETGAGLRFFNKFRGFCTQTPARKNWYLQFMLFGQVLFEEALPAYLSSGGKLLKEDYKRLQFIRKSYTDMLAESPAGYYNKFALSNVSDWLNAEEMMTLMKLIGERSGKDGRGLIRYLHASGIVAHTLPVNIKLKNKAGEKLREQDRFPFYNLIPFEIKEREAVREPKKESRKANPTLYETRELGPEWNDQLLQIARESPVEADGLQVLFDRSPNIFTIPKLTSYCFRCGGLFRRDQLLGFAIIAFQNRYVDKQRLGGLMYLGNMHVSKENRGLGFYYRMSDFLFGEIPSEVDYGYAYVMKQNSSALKFINHRHPRFPRIPHSMTIGEIVMVTIFLSVPVMQHHNFAVRVATSDDIDQIVDLLLEEHENRFLAPAMSREIFLKNLKSRPHFGLENYLVAVSGQEILGVCSTWDMTPFKKSRILKYGKKLDVYRRLYNTAAKLFQVAPLPEPGEALRDITIAEYAVKGRDPAIMEALLRYCYKRFRKKGYHSILFGSSADDPLLEVTKKFFTNEVRSYVILSSSRWEKIARKKGTPLIYADTIQI